MILEWTPYINEYLMPNVAACFEKQPESKTLSQAPNGGIYGLPYYNPSVYGSGCYGLSQRLYFRQSWLDQVGLGNPVTKTELLNVLRAFKNQITDKTADRQDVPLVSGDGLLEKYLWTCMGFYGCEPDRFGSSLSIKDGELVLPAYTESYREFVTIMKTMYGEGLIGKNFFDYDNASAGHQIGLDQCGALCWENLACVGEDFSDIVCANLIPMGDVDSITDIHASLPASVYPNYIWANSRYEEPRILAMLIDFVYSEEGAWLYRYGPKQGEDPLGLVDGWYLDDSGNVTTKQVEEGKYASMAAYGSTVLFPNDYVGMCRAAIHATTDAMVELTDSVTGETYYCVDTGSVSGDTNDGYWQQITMQKWSDRATSVRIPAVYLNADEMPEFTDYKNAISAWVRSETAKFITGVRPVSEIEEFWKELENLGVERYLQLAKEGCADWMKATFG